MFLTSVKEELGSYLGWNTDYRQIILGFTQSLQENLGYVLKLGEGRLFLR
jgi:hypothetical protein